MRRNLKKAKNPPALPLAKSAKVCYTNEEYQRAYLPAFHLKPTLEVL